MVVGEDDDLDKLYYADDLDEPPLPRKKVPVGDVYEAARAGDIARLKFLIESGINVNKRDAWDSVSLYYACLAGHLDAAKLLLDNGAICSEHTFDGDRCHYAALNLDVRRLLKAYEARPPPLEPLPDALRSLFFNSGENSNYLDPTLVSAGTSDIAIAPDITFFVEGKPIAAHRAILAARSPYFRNKFQNEWRGRRTMRFSSAKLNFSSLFSLISFFYCDRLDVTLDDMPNLVVICKVLKCSGLHSLLEKEIIHHKYADYKSLTGVDDSQKRFILQGSSLPEEERLAAAMKTLISLCLSEEQDEDFADICFDVEGRKFRCHRAILAARSDYLRARICRMNGFKEGLTAAANDVQTAAAATNNVQVLEEHQLSAKCFLKLLHYIYSDVLDEIDYDGAEEMLDVASRYLLFPLKRAVADALLPALENASSAEICRWLLIADMYGVGKVREYCLDAIALNFEAFITTDEFISVVRKLPPPSGDSSTRNSQGNILDDLREKWLQAEGAELNERDKSAHEFDKRLELLSANILY